MHNIYQKIALWFFVIALLLLGAGGYFYGKTHNSTAYRAINSTVQRIAWWQDQPALEQKVLTHVNVDKPDPLDSLPPQRTVEFTWRYEGQDYLLHIDLSKNIYDQYRNSPKTYSYVGRLPADWVEQYYSMFFNLKPEDQTINQIVDELTQLAKDNSLSSDQLVELTMAFVQSIPYDDTRAGNIINHTNGESNSYPYETLYVNAGICFDKTFLAILILQKLGYGTAVLDFPEANHSAVGIACPADYSIYGSGYCFAESTNFFPVGVVPQLKEDIVSFNQGLATFSGQFDNIFNPQSLGRASIINKTDGKQYKGIEETYKKVEAIKALEKTLDEERLVIKQKEDDALKRKEDIVALEDTMKKYQQAGNNASYQNLMPSYEMKIKTYNDLVGLIQLKIKLLNEDVVAYNAMITDFVLPAGDN
jgi:hypothetical protein